MTHNKFKFLILLLFLIIAYLFFLSQPPKDFPSNRIISIEEGRSIKAVSQILKKEKIIKSTELFEILIQFSETKSVKAGDYLFDKKINIFEVVNKMENGRFNIPIIKITFNEGMTIEEMAGKLEKDLINFDKDTFLNLALKYEGYLFPDTYQFNYNTEEVNVIETMRDNFNNKMLSIKKEIENSEKNLDDIITMASIVEKEATRETIQEVTNVLWNRIEIDMPLQVDATFVYSIEKHSFNVTKKEMQDETNIYNTYTNLGLPPTPISNPGMESIMASINHQPTEHLFFLTGRDGEMYFATTFEEHKQNRNLYLD